MSVSCSITIDLQKVCTFSKFNLWNGRAYNNGKPIPFSYGQSMIVMWETSLALLLAIAEYAIMYNSPCFMAVRLHVTQVFKCKSWDNAVSRFVILEFVLAPRSEKQVVQRDGFFVHLFLACSTVLRLCASIWCISRCKAWRAWIMLIALLSKALFTPCACHRSGVWGKWLRFRQTYHSNGDGWHEAL